MKQLKLSKKSLVTGKLNRGKEKLKSEKFYCKHLYYAIVTRGSIVQTSGYTMKQNRQPGRDTVFTRTNAAAFIEFFVLRLQRLFEGGVYCKVYSNRPGALIKELPRRKR